MPYGDDLYKKENIFAYTGEIGKNPTVYFRREVINDTGQKMTEYGRITQDHNNKFNVGRAEVAQSTKYKIKNKIVQRDEIIDGKKTGKQVDVLRSKEYAVLPKKGQKKGDKVEYEYRRFHTSRNPHVEVASDDHKTKDLLASALEAHKDIKPKSSKIYVENKVEEFKNDKDFATKLDELDAKIDEMAKQSIKNQPDRKEKHQKTQAKLKSFVQEKRELAVKKHEKAKPDLSNFGKPLNSDKKEIVDRVKEKRKSEQNIGQDSKKRIRSATI